MRRYKPRWKIAVGVSLGIHAVLALLFLVVLPLFSKPSQAEPPAEQTVDWQEPAEENTQAEGVDSAEAEQQESDEQADGDEQPETSNVPEPVPQEIQPETVPSKDTAQETTPIVADTPQEAIAVLKKEDAKPSGKKGSHTIVAIKKNGSGQEMGQPATLIKSVQPPKGTIQYHGRVNVFITISAKGKVSKTAIAVSGGNKEVDKIAMATAAKWIFKPALDHKGIPMESIYLARIVFP